MFFFKVTLEISKKYYFIVNSIILFYSKFFLKFKYEVQENLDKIEFKIDNERKDDIIVTNLDRDYYANNKNMIGNYEAIPN